MKQRRGTEKQVGWFREPEMAKYMTRIIQIWGVVQSEQSPGKLHIPHSTGKVEWKLFSHVWVFVTPSPWNSPGQNTGVGSLSFLQGNFPTQGLNPGLPHCRQILYQLSHQGSPRILQWVAYPFSKGSSQPRNGTGISCIAGRFFTNWDIRESLSTGEDFITTDINLC